MAGKIHKPTAVVADTQAATVSGNAAKHPVWKAVRAVAGRITTPLLPDDYLQLANPLWSARELRGRIVEVRRETTDCATLVIKPGWGFQFDYQPGQYIGIGVLVDGRWRWRSYSLTSSPGAAGPATSGRCGVLRSTNRAGGLEGGMTNGQPLRVRAAMKPISTVPRALATVDMATGEEAVAIHQRSDVCAVPAAGVVAEAMVALVLARAALEKFGGDSIVETKNNIASYLAGIRDHDARASG